MSGDRAIGLLQSESRLLRKWEGRMPDMGSHNGAKRTALCSAMRSLFALLYPGIE